MFVRLFVSAIDPVELDEVRRIFTEDVKPVLERQPGCQGIELAVNVDANAGGLVEGAAISRWTTKEDLDRALATREVAESIVRVRHLLRQEPLTKTYEVVG